MKLILIRHGLPVRSDTSSDPSLAPEGVRQARRMADWLRHERIDALYSSPMRRARETADPLAAVTGLAPRVIDDVAEYDRHSGAYVPMEELKRTDYAAWQTQMAGRGVDDIAAFRERVVRALGAIVAEQRRRDYYRDNYYYGGGPYYGRRYYGGPAYYGGYPYQGGGYYTVPRY
jgi:probable phosphoglycerate mutase